MTRKNTIPILLAALIFCGGCTNTRYLTDSVSIGRQHDMRLNRTGKNIGTGCLNFANLVLSSILDIEFQAIQSERKFKKITLVNESADSLIINMVTDVVWKESGYCDIMGIVLPPQARQKLLVPYPAAYNVYFKTPVSEEEKLEVRTDNKHRIIKLRSGMTEWLKEN